MGISLYDHVVSQLSDSLDSLTAILNKSADEKDINALLSARLVPDMLPLSFQIYTVTDMTLKAVSRAHGDEPATQEPHEKITTIAEARKRIAAAQEILATADAAKWAARTNEPVEFGLGPSKTAILPLKDYFSAYIIPNLYFHLSMAYAVVRLNGVSVGKKDYLGSFGLAKATIKDT